MNTELIAQVLSQFVVASVVFYFYVQTSNRDKDQIAKLEAENERLRAQHEEDLQKAIRRRAGDTGRIPELPPDEVKKFKKSIGE